MVNEIKSFRVYGFSHILECCLDKRGLFMRRAFLSFPSKNVGNRKLIKVCRALPFFFPLFGGLVSNLRMTHHLALLSQDGILAISQIC